MTTRVKLNSSGLVKVTDDGTETVIINVNETYVTSDTFSTATLTATSATTIADAASTSASNATTAASNATTIADAASTSASNAKTDADAASTSASNAKTDADAASTSASDATTAASNAKTDADAAESNALSASNLLVTRDYNGTNTTIGAVPSETLMIIVYNTGGEMELTGSAATVKLVRQEGADGVNSNNTIKIPRESTTILILEKTNVFRFLFSVKDGTYHQNVYRDS